jgi:regulator of sigma E protease
MNILPIPALDGGHVLFLLIELITKKKINEKVESVITTIFFGLLLLLMLYITIHDVITLIL